jgi:hypothetical protein
MFILKSLVATLALMSALAPTAGSAATVTWVGGTGDWSAPGNWSAGTVPGPSDDAVIPAGASITVTHSTGADAVNSIVCHQTFTLAGGSLSVETTFQTDSTLNLSGGTLVRANLQAQNGGLVVVGTGGGTFDGVVFSGLLDVGNSVNTATLLVTNGLVLNGRALVGNPSSGNGSWGAIYFAGTQTLGGGGIIVFGNGSCNDFTLTQAGTTLTIASGITVRGQSGALGYNSCLGGQQSFAVVNQGTISADVAGGTITVNAQPFVNQGFAQSPAGTLNLSGTIASGGLGVLQAGNGTLSLSGYLTNDNQVAVLPGANNPLTWPGA